MLVMFRDNYDCVIKKSETLKLGEVLCDILNINIDKLKTLKKQLSEELQSINPLQNRILQNTVNYYSSLLSEKEIVLAHYQSEMSKLPFYMYSNDAYDSFIQIYSFIKEMKKQLTYKLQTAPVQDVELIFDKKMFETAVTGLLKFLIDINNTYVILCSPVKECLLYNSATAEEKPVQKLKKYGIDKVNSAFFISSLKKPLKTEMSSLSLLYEFDVDSDSLSLVQYFNVDTLPQYIYHEFMMMVRSNLHVKNCKYCGKYFVIYSERIPEYCNNVPEGETKPCSVIGPSRLYGEKVKSDPILDIYTRAYKKYVARRRSGSISPEEFKQWTVKVRELREKAYTEGITSDVFAEWMK